MDPSIIGNIDIRGFLKIFRMGQAGQLAHGSGLSSLFAQMNEVDVVTEGVGVAKNFFEAKVKKHSSSVQYILFNLRILLFYP